MLDDDDDIAGHAAPLGGIAGSSSQAGRPRRAQVVLALLFPLQPRHPYEVFLHGRQAH